MSGTSAGTTCGPLSCCGPAWTALAKYLDALAALRAVDPALILSIHLPPAVGRAPEFLLMLAAAPGASPFIGPDQAALERLLATFEPAAQPVSLIAAGATTTKEL